MKVKGHRQSVVRGMLAGLAAVLFINAHARDAGAANVCNAALDSMFVSGPNFVVPGDATRDTVRLQLTLGAGTITGSPTPPGPQLTLHRLKFDLDCSTGGLPCGDQGNVVSYGGDSTVTTDCPGVTWTTNVPGGGSATNEVVFTPSTPIVIAGGVNNFCHLEFDLIVVNPEPTSGPQSDNTPLVIEEVAGFVQAAAFADGDATCNNGLQAGNQGSAAIPQCPVPCAGDECTDRVCPDDTTNPNAGTCVGTPKTSQPCTDSDNNVCTIAGCEASPTDPTSGVCVQTHTFATDSTRRAGDDDTAGPDAATGQGTPKTSPPCTDTDGNVCTIAGCEVSPTNSELGVCVQNHMFASDSTPCPDTDNDSCTTAGCNGQGVCDQTHMQCVKGLGCRVTGGGTVDACGTGDSGCDSNTPGSCAPDTCASPALEATHGGQVGASIGVATAFTADSACIAGEWTHVRHIRPRLFGNFHARSFDSLMCACLSCPENPDVQGVPGTLCNPDDRICGPEPRRAPANKICFSGAGDYALTNGRRESRSVVFRGDVEDRSGPGGTNGKPPPDRD